MQTVMADGQNKAVYGPHTHTGRKPSAQGCVLVRSSRSPRGLRGPGGCAQTGPRHRGFPGALLQHPLGKVGKFNCLGFFLYLSKPTRW